MKNNLKLGKATEMRVASEILLRGHNVFFPMVDDGIDIILENDLRIQIKGATGRFLDKDKVSLGYTFSFRSWKRSRDSHEPHNLDRIDFVILWAIGADLFYIIPSVEIRGKYTVRVTPHGKRRKSTYTKWINRWDLLDSEEVMP